MSKYTVASGCFTVKAGYPERQKGREHSTICPWTLLGAHKSLGRQGEGMEREKGCGLTCPRSQTGKRPNRDTDPGLIPNPIFFPLHQQR